LPSNPPSWPPAIPFTLLPTCTPTPLDVSCPIAQPSGASNAHGFETACHYANDSDSANAVPAYGVQSGNRGGHAHNGEPAVSNSGMPGPPSGEDKTIGEDMGCEDMNAFRHGTKKIDRQISRLKTARDDSDSRISPAVEGAGAWHATAVTTPDVAMSTLAIERLDEVYFVKAIADRGRLEMGSQLPALRAPGLWEEKMYDESYVFQNMQSNAVHDDASMLATGGENMASFSGRQTVTHATEQLRQGLDGAPLPAPVTSQKGTIQKDITEMAAYAKAEPRSVETAYIAASQTFELGLAATSTSLALSSHTPSPVASPEAFSDAIPEKTLNTASHAHPLASSLATISVNSMPSSAEAVASPQSSASYLAIATPADEADADRLLPAVSATSSDVNVVVETNSCLLPSSPGIASGPAPGAPSMNVGPGLSAALSTAMRNDPNNIFGVLTSRMAALELNQSLINNWLTLWQAQIGEKLKKLNATHEETKRGMRALASEMNRTSLMLRTVTRKVNDEGRGDLLTQMNSLHVSTNASVLVLNWEIKTLADTLEHVKVETSDLRKEIIHISMRNRIELIACMSLSLALSSLLAIHCTQAQYQRRRNTDSSCACNDHLSPQLPSDHAPVRHTA